MNYVYGTVIACIIALCSAALPLLGQQYLPKRNMHPDHIADLKRRIVYHTDSNRIIRCYKLCPIKSIPPIHTGMPYDVLLSYIAFDSLRQRSSSPKLREFAKAHQVLDDTVKTILKHYYQVVDYNPTLWEQYSIQLMYTPHLTYSANQLSPSIFRSILLSNEGLSLEKILPSGNKGYPYKLLFRSSYVARVKILSKEVNPNFEGDTIVATYTAQVLDKIKGQHLPVECDTPSNTMSAPQDIIMFDLFESLFISDYYGDSFDFKTDPALFADTQSNYPLSVGQEFIVFLAASVDRIDNSHDYLVWGMHRGRVEFFPLPIVDGQVRDINRFWSDNELLPYQQWRERANEYIQNILNKTY